MIYDQTKADLVLLPQSSRHYVGDPMIWQIWQYQMIRQHQTTLGSQDLALLDPERDLSVKENKYISLKSNFKVLG